MILELSLKVNEMRFRLMFHEGWGFGSYGVMKNECSLSKLVFCHCENHDNKLKFKMYGG